jgi:hypothetical protein
MPAVKIGISVSAELAEKLTLHKGRFNISQVCADALEKKIKEIEDAAGPAEALTDLIVRIRAQAEARQTTIYQAGLKNSLQHAIQASLDDFELYEKWNMLPDPATHFHMLPAPAKAELTSLEMQANEAERGSVIRQYVRGWLDGILSVWQRIKADL